MHHIQGLEVVVHVHAEPRPRLLAVLDRDLGGLVGHVPDVADAGLHHVVPAQISSDRARFSGGLDDHQAMAAALPGGILPRGATPPSRRALGSGWSLCWHAPHLLAPVPLPSVCHAGPKFRVPASVFPTLMPPPVFPAGSDTPPGATRTCTRRPPAHRAPPVPPACAKDTNARVFLPRCLSIPRHVTGRCPAHPDGSRRARGLGTRPRTALRRWEQESHPAAPDHTRSSHPLMCTSGEIGKRFATVSAGAALSRPRGAALSSGPGSRRARARRT